jgi:hypothetical protein
MTDTGTSLLSTQAKKLYQDIQFATALGRDSPFDPFQGRDITKLFSERKEPSGALMYFSTKPMRKGPAALPFGRTTGRQAVTSGAPPGPQLIDASYDLSPLPEGPKVSFTKASRNAFSHLPAPPKDDHDSPDKQPKRDVGTEGITSMNEEDFLTCRQRAQKRSTQRPSSVVQHGSTFGRGADRSGHAPGGSHSRLSQPTSARPDSPSHRKNYLFPWEQTKVTKPRAPLSHAPVSPAAGAAGSLNASVQLGDTDLTSPTNATGKDVLNEVETEAAWLEMRRQFINRFGLLGGANHRRSNGPKGPEFSLMPSRKAPMGFQPPGKECNDVMYAPKDTVTTKRRSVAHVELGKQASRFQGPNEQLRHVSHLLDYDHLAKLHHSTRQKEKRAFAGIQSVHAGTSSNDAGSVSNSVEDRIFERPLTAADEVAYNWASLRPPTRTNYVAYTSDAYLGADRSDEPLSSVLGGDPRPYRRAAKRALSSMA